MELDALTASHGTTHSADVCIVGAGPAGLSLAQALASRGAETVLIESGHDLQGPARELNAGFASGHALGDLRDSRGRAVGGSALLWSTIREGVAGAKYVPLDPIDLSPRDELPFSGWPITWAQLEPWYARAASLLDLPPIAPVDADAMLPFGEGSLTSSSYRWGPAAVFRRELPALLAAHDNVRLIRNATVTRLDSIVNRVDAIRWQALSGAAGTVMAKRVVLAGGAIENARMLLASTIDRDDPGDWLGRGLMEHPIDHSLRLVSRHRALSPAAGAYAPMGAGRRGRLIGRIGCSEEMLRADWLWNASLRLFPVPERRLARAAKRVASAMRLLTSTAYRVLLDLEQAPHRDNRVTLTTSFDAFGVPMANVHWAWHAADEANRQRMVAAIIRAFQRAGAGTLQHDATASVDPDVHHHAGTTRMSDDPRDGVVDANLKVHGTANLYVAGASVFPTSGVANPTLTIVALSLRLAQELGGGAGSR